MKIIWKYLAAERKLRQKVFHMMAVKEPANMQKRLAKAPCKRVEANSNNKHRTSKKKKKKEDDSALMLREFGVRGALFLSLSVSVSVFFPRLHLLCGKRKTHTFASQSAATFFPPRALHTI